MTQCQLRVAKCKISGLTTSWRKSSITKKSSAKVLLERETGAEERLIYQHGVCEGSGIIGWPLFGDSESIAGSKSGPALSSWDKSSSAYMPSLARHRT